MILFGTRHYVRGPGCFIWQLCWSVPSQGMVGHFSATASNISWIVWRSHVMPHYIRMHLNLLNSVTYKLFVLSWASYPMQDNGAIEPAVLHAYRKSFDKRFTAMWPDTNSNRGIVNPFFANLALEATSPWTAFSCTTTVYTAAATPFPLASPKVCNYIAWMSVWCAANDWGTVT